MVAQQVPITPGAIPPPSFDSGHNQSILRSIRNPLRFGPQGGYLSFLGLPGVVIGGMVLGYLIGKYRFNLLFLLPVAHGVYFVLKRRADIYARSVEALCNEKARHERVGEYETVEWMNYIISKFWEVAEAGVSSQIYSAVNEELRKNTPSFLKSLKLTEITLGTRPPVIERIGFVEKNDDVMTLECAFNFVPVETSEDVLFYFGEERHHWNTRIELTAKVGFLSIPLLIRNLAFSGMIRIQLDLTRRIPFLKSAKISMMNLPVVDFGILPLRAADLMDISYLSGFIHRLIDSSVSNMLLYPKSIDIDLQGLADYRGKEIGVVFVHIYTLEAIQEEPVFVSLSLGGREFGRTSQQSGEDPLFNEGFYTVVMDTTKTLSLHLHTPSETLSGFIFLRNLNRHTYAESVHLSSEASRHFLNVSTSFFPISNSFTESAIISFTLISIRDLQALGCPKNKVYTTYARMSLDIKEGSGLSQTVQSFESKRIFSSKDPFYNENIKFFVRNFTDYVIKITVIDDHTEETIGRLVIPLEGIKHQAPGMYRLSSVESGEVEVKFDVSYINMYPSVSERGPFEENVKSVVSEEKSLASEETAVSTEEWESTSEENVLAGSYVEISSDSPVESLPHSHTPPLSIGIYNLDKPNNDFIDFKYALKVSIKSVSGCGSFYIVFETNHSQRRTEPFSTDIPLFPWVVLPLVNETSIRARLFKMLINGDALVGETLFSPSDSVAVFDRIRVEFSTEISDLVGSTSASLCRIVQCLILPPSADLPAVHKKSVFSTEIYANGTSLVGQSVAGTLFNFSATGAPLRGAVRENGKSLVSFSFDVDTYEQEISLTPELSTKILMRSYVTQFPATTPPIRGFLEVFVIRAFDILPLRSDRTDPYVKVYQNGQKVFRSNIKHDELSPVFHESFKIFVERGRDTLEFSINDRSSITSGDTICYKEIPLFNIPQGYSRFELQMKNRKDGNPSKTRLQLIFNYSGSS